MLYVRKKRRIGEIKGNTERREEMFTQLPSKCQAEGDGLWFTNSNTILSDWCHAQVQTPQKTEKNSRRQSTIHEKFEAEKQNLERKIEGMY